MMNESLEKNNQENFDATNCEAQTTNVQTENGKVSMICKTAVLAILGTVGCITLGKHIFQPFIEGTTAKDVTKLNCNMKMFKETEKTKRSEIYVEGGKSVVKMLTGFMPQNVIKHLF